MIQNGVHRFGIAQQSSQSLAPRFIVGETPKAALGDLRDLWKDGVASSVDLLGEAPVTQAEAQRARAARRGILEVTSLFAEAQASGTRR